MLSFIFTILLLLPGVALAQDASMLGPQSLNSNTSSPQTLNVLQPQSSDGTLQAGNSASNSLAPSSSSNLQQAGDSNQVKIFMEGEGEGSRELTEAEETSANAPYWILIIPMIIAVALWLNRRYKGQIAVETTTAEVAALSVSNTGSVTASHSTKTKKKSKSKTKAKPKSKRK